MGVGEGHGDARGGRALQSPRGARTASTVERANQDSRQVLVSTGSIWPESAGKASHGEQAEIASHADRTAVAAQLGREPSIPFSVVARCGAGHPLVIRNRPVDAEGQPFPTLYWLTCPEAVAAVS